MYSLVWNWPGDVQNSVENWEKILQSNGILSCDDYVFFFTKEGIHNGMYTTLLKITLLFSYFYSASILCVKYFGMGIFI